MKTNQIVIAAVVVLLLIGGIFYVESTQNSNPTINPVTSAQPTLDMSSTSPDMSSSPTASGSGATQGTVKEFTVEGSNFKFAPATLSVNKGDTVKITFNNTGGMHDFVIDEFNAKTKVIQSGATHTVTFVADKTGTFNYYCSVGNHRVMGMQGVLTVQ